MNSDERSLPHLGKTIKVPPPEILTEEEVKVICGRLIAEGKLPKDFPREAHEKLRGQRRG